MSLQLEELSQRLEMPLEHLDSLFAVAGIKDAKTNVPLALARLSYFLSKKLVPRVQAETERRRQLRALEDKLIALEVRHERVFGFVPLLPNFIPVKERIDMVDDALRLGVPHDARWSALRCMYSEVFFAPPPAFDDANEELWVNQVLTAIALMRPIKDDAGVEYVDSSKFGAQRAPEVS